MADKGILPMKNIALKDLLEAGCHFGHQSNRWHPKAVSYIFDERDGVHIIDLAKTKAGLITAGEYLADLAKNDGKIIFVGVKRQAKAVVTEAAKKAGVYFVTERWPGGLLTNFSVMKRNLARIEELKARSTDTSYTKKERLLANRDMEKLLRVYEGLVGLDSLPNAVYLVDIKKMEGAAREAKATGVKMVAITDTNADPTDIDYQIPANDDAVGSIKIITDYLADCWLEGKGKNKDNKNNKINKENEAHHS